MPEEWRGKVCPRQRSRILAEKSLMCSRNQEEASQLEPDEPDERKGERRGGWLGRQGVMFPDSAARSEDFVLGSNACESH